MYIAEMSGNARNKLNGQRITIYLNDGTIVDRFIVRSMYGAKRYCLKHPGGYYGKRYRVAIAKAIELEKLQGIGDEEIVEGDN